MISKLKELISLLKQCKELADELDLCWIANQSKHAISEINKHIADVNKMVSNSEINNPTIRKNRIVKNKEK